MSGPIDLIKKSLNIFFEKKNLVTFFKIYIWLLPFQLFFLYQNYFINVQSKILNTIDTQEIIFKFPWFLGSIVVVNIFFIVASFIVEVVVLKTITDIIKGKSISIKETYLSSRKIIWPFAMLSILVGLIQLGGFILLIIPGIIFSVWFSFSKFIFVNKNKGIKDSLKISKSLVKGRFWQIFGRSIVFIFFMILFQSVFMIVPYGIGSMLSEFFGALFVLPYFLLYKEISDE